MEAKRKVVATLVPRVPVRETVHAKRQRTDPPVLLDDDWLEGEVPVSGPPVPICCAFRTCKKHKQATVVASKVDK